MSAPTSGSEPSPAHSKGARWRSRLVAAMRDLVILMAIVTAIGAWQNRALLSRGSSMPDFSFATTDHQVVSAESLRGKKTMMVVWAPWCGVCKVESPNVSRVHRWMGEGSNVVSLAIGYRDYASVSEFMRARSVDYPVLLGDEEIEDALQIARLPTIYFFDKEGRVTFRTSGYTTTLGLLVRLWLS